MAGPHHLPEVERLVLATIGPQGNTIETIAGQLGHPAEAVDAAVRQLVHAGLVQAVGGLVRLTGQGRLVAAGTSSSAVQTPQAEAPADGDVAGSIESVWSSYLEHRAAARGRVRDEMLASDKDRDAVSKLLADAFAQGRLSAVEFETRTGRALSAVTHGDLDDVLQGLGGSWRPAGTHPVRKGLFAMVAFVSSPFVLFGALLLLAGSDAGDRVSGTVFLILFLPGLFALWRWAWPRG